MRSALPNQLVGEVALVTGAGQGIGAAILDALKNEGATVTGLDRQAGTTDHHFDLNQLESIPAFVNSLPVCPTILVNAAGICLTRPFFEIELAGFEQTLRINLLASFALMQSVCRRLVQDGMSGVILNIASNSAFMPKLEQLDYGASKAAIVSMTRSSAASLGPYGIRVNAIAPGIINTPLTQAIAQSRADIRGTTPEETLRPVLHNLPLGRIGQPEEAAQLAVFLCSPNARFITGQTYLIDGGQLMR